jgi:hypothetical protein
MKNGADKSYALFRSLVTALLNQAAGARSECIEEDIADAQAWLALHAPGSRVKANSEAWQNEGKVLNQHLESYNEGEMCAPERNECEEPVSLSSAILPDADGQPKGLQVRIHAEKGRTLVLQRSANAEDWEEVEVLENMHGVSEAVRAEIANEPMMFYRIVFPEGPAQVADSIPSSRGPFRQVGSGETVELLPLLYEGDLSVNGHANVISGKVVNGQLGTVIAGDLILKGNGNQVSNLKVLGQVVFKGHDNELDNVEYEEETETETESP